MALSNEKSMDFKGMEVECAQLNIGPRGTVTQITSRATGVTLNTVSGAITTDVTALAAESTADFIVTCNSCSIGTVPNVAVAGGSNGGGTIVSVTGVAAGSFTIRVHNGNVAAGTAETGAIVINYILVNGL